jgi:hypothetical protein
MPYCPECEATYNAEKCPSCGYVDNKCHCYGGCHAYGTLLCPRTAPDFSREGLVKALKRIRDSEPRSDRRKRGMVDISEVESLQRTARVALDLFTGEDGG